GAREVARRPAYPHPDPPPHAGEGANPPVVTNERLRKTEKNPKNLMATTGNGSVRNETRARRGSLLKSAGFAAPAAPSPPSSTTAAVSFFANVELVPGDPILGLTEAYNADSRATKVNLGVGIYY